MKDEQCTEQFVGKLLYMCQERADVRYSVKETVRKITCPAESDEMNVKRIARYLKRCPERKVFDRDQHIFPPFVNVHTDSEWAGQHQTCKSTSGGVYAVGKRHSFCLFRNTAVNELEFRPKE